MRTPRWRDDVWGRAYEAHKRDLTSTGLTQPDYLADPSDAGPGMIVVVVAAHDEEAFIGESLESLAARRGSPTR